MQSRPPTEHADTGLAVKFRVIGRTVTLRTSSSTAVDTWAPPSSPATGARPAPRPEGVRGIVTDLAQLFIAAAAAFVLAEAWFPRLLVFLALLGVALTVQTLVALLAPDTSHRVFGTRAIPPHVAAYCAVAAGAVGFVLFGWFAVTA